MHFRLRLMYIRATPVPNIEPKCVMSTAVRRRFARRAFAVLTTRYLVRLIALRFRHCCNFRGNLVPACEIYTTKNALGLPYSSPAALAVVFIFFILLKRLDRNDTRVQFSHKVYRVFLSLRFYSFYLLPTFSFFFICSSLSL